MRIYLVGTGTGGKVLGSFEVGSIYRVQDDGVFNFTTDEYCATFANIIDPMSEAIGRIEGWSYIKRQGYTDQEHAIRIIDFREEDGLILDVWRRCSILCGDFKKVSNIRECECTYVNMPIMRYNSKDFIKRTPQSFCYIQDPYTGEKAILMSIHPKWFEMIRSGEKIYEFRNVLPLALRGE